MNLWKRAKNLWRLSEYVPGQPNEEYKIPGTQIAIIVKKPEQKTAQVISYKKQNLIQELLQESETI